MAAWIHTTYWDSEMYARYRRFVSDTAQNYRGRPEDCADISIFLIVDFAAAKGLPLTFWDNNQVRYISKGTRQHPADDRPFGTLSWKNKSEYMDAVKRRISSDSLVQQNTLVNGHGPEPGDLMSKQDHTALVFRVYAAGVRHPRAGDKTIPLFPGHDQAKKQLNQLEYFRQQVPGRDEYRPNEIDVGAHMDYLNHRGDGKQAAELIYYSNVDEFRRDGFQYRMYTPGVLDNWIDWSGIGGPPR